MDGVCRGTISISLLRFGCGLRPTRRDRLEEGMERIAFIGGKKSALNTYFLESI
jgi:hypothetical protein